MYEMTIEGLLRVGNSEFAKEDAKYMIVQIEAFGQPVETIINPKENFKAKLDYYESAYNNDLTLKNNRDIKIVNYDFVTDLAVHIAENFKI